MSASISTQTTTQKQKHRDSSSSFHGPQGGILLFLFLWKTVFFRETEVQHAVRPSPEQNWLQNHWDKCCFHTNYRKIHWFFLIFSFQYSFAFIVIYFLVSLNFLYLLSIDHKFNSHSHGLLTVSSCLNWDLILGIAFWNARCILVFVCWFSLFMESSQSR